MSYPRTRSAVVLAVALCAVTASTARAQWGYPGGFGGYGWGGWGATTPQGDMARGMGVFAAGAGIYNKQTAIADAIDADTVMRWNEYLYQSQQARNRRFWERQARDRATNIRVQEEIQTRLRENPEPRDVFRGSALNVLLDELNSPRVYAKALQGANAPIGSDKVRLIPFQYAAAGITMSIHQLTTGALPASLRTPEFEEDRKALKTLDEQILKQIDENDTPDPETVKKFLAAIYAAEEKAARILPKNSLDARQAERYLHALHSLVAMLKSPVLDEFLAGVEKRPQVTLGELLSFMTAFNLRFAPATSPQQREVYSDLYRRLVGLRNQIAPAIANAKAPKTTGTEPEEFFAGMHFDDLKKKAPKP